MNLDLVNLVKLQRQDQRLAELKRVEDEGPLKLKEADLELEAAEQRVKESLTREQEMIKRRRVLEAEIEDTDEKIKENLARQLRIKTNEEYRALQDQIGRLRDQVGELEEEILASYDLQLQSILTLSRRRTVRENLARCDESFTCGVLIPFRKKRLGSLGDPWSRIPRM